MLTEWLLSRFVVMVKRRWQKEKSTKKKCDMWYWRCNTWSLIWSSDVFSRINFVANAFQKAESVAVLSFGEYIAWWRSATYLVNMMQIQYTKVCKNPKCQSMLIELPSTHYFSQRFQNVILRQPASSQLSAGHDRYKQLDLLISSQPISSQRLPSEFATPRLFVEY